MCLCIHIYMQRYIYMHACVHTHAWLDAALISFPVPEPVGLASFNIFSGGRSAGKSLWKPKIWDSPSLRFKTQSFEKNPNYGDPHDLPVCFQHKNQNASFALFLPNVANFCNIAESLFAVVMSPPLLAACYLQPNSLSHGQAPWKQEWGSPVSPTAAPLQQDPHWGWPCCGSAKKAIPMAGVWLGVCKPLPWTSCLISRELTQKHFSSVSPLYLAPEKPCSLTTVNTFSW